MSISRLHRIKIGPRNKYRNLTGPTLQCRTSQISMHCRASKRSILRPFFKLFLLINFSGVHIYCQLDIHTPAQIDCVSFVLARGAIRNYLLVLLEMLQRKEVWIIGWNWQMPCSQNLLNKIHMSGVVLHRH